jgi:hypothetical protein
LHLPLDIAFTSFVLGYHGCDAAVAEHVFAGRTPLRPSHNDYDWLGDGTYFWEHNPSRAFEFAREVAQRPHPSGQKIKSPAVVGAVIDLRFCLNLLDGRFIEMVRDAHAELVRLADQTGTELPRNTGGQDLFRRNLDCAVLRMLHQSRDEAGEPPFDTVRAAFVEGGPLYENAGFATKSHIQICVRNPACIKGYFRPLDESENPLAFT